MKKITIASLLIAMFAIPAMANTEIAPIRMDANPLYRPQENHFFSETSLDMNTDLEHFVMAEKFGYGITDRVSLFLKTAGSYDSGDMPAYGTKYNWDNMALGMSYRYLNMNMWKGDVYGSAQQNYNTSDGLNVDSYNWTLGTTWGYVVHHAWTLAMTAEANYLTDDYRDNNQGAWGMKLGLDGLYNFTQHWNMTAGMMYDFNLDGEYYIGNPLSAKVGVNYNFDNWTYLGAYFYKDVKSGFNVDPLAMGVKFGIDF